MYNLNNGKEFEKAKWGLLAFAKTISNKNHVQTEALEYMPVTRTNRPV